MRTVSLAALSCVLVLLGSCTPHPQEALSIAAARGDPAALNALLAQNPAPGEVTAALVWAARSGQPESVSTLIQHGADANATSGVNDWSVLMHAIHKDQPRSVLALLEHGANANLAGPGGETPLMMAAGYGYADIVRILLQHGANAHASLPNGENALDAALSGTTDIDRFTWGSCQTETVRLLRRSVPDLRPKNAAKLKRCS